MLLSSDFAVHLLEAIVLGADSPEAWGIYLTWGSMGKETVCSLPVLVGTFSMIAEGLCQVTHPVQTVESLKPTSQHPRRVAIFLWEHTL